MNGIKVDAAESIDFGLPRADALENEKDSGFPIVNMVDSLIFKAFAERASDIHIEAKEKEALVRYRIDGVLHEVMRPPKSMLPAIVSRIKVMSNLKLDEKRVPQDGRIRMRIKELSQDVDLRVSTLPTLYGENVVMRILDQKNMEVNLDKLGIDAIVLDPWRRLASLPQGILLITGPTGSGKSTTIYATLNMLDSSHAKIVTIEDPIEYYLEGINQVQVNPRVGLSFATGLRAFLRQDPDIMMVGEIRDRETAGIAIESALTGHLVFSTLHTNSSVGAITRLVDMGIEPYLLSAGILGVLAQRLVRLICDRCKVPILNPNEEILRHFEENGIKQYELYEGRGCSYCAGTGYRGRRGVYELFIPSMAAKSLISKAATEDMLEKRALEDGLVTLHKDGLQKVAQGITTYEEICRVTARL